MTLGERIKSRREELGLTQSKLAHKTRMTPHDICRFETGRTLSPNIETLSKLARALGTTVGWLANGEGENS